MVARKVLPVTKPARGVNIGKAVKFGPSVAQKIGGAKLNRGVADSAWAKGKVPPAAIKRRLKKPALPSKPSGMSNVAGRAVEMKNLAQRKS